MARKVEAYQGSTREEGNKDRNFSSERCKTKQKDRIFEVFLQEETTTSERDALSERQESGAAENAVHEIHQRGLAGAGKPEKQDGDDRGDVGLVLGNPTGREPEVASIVRQQLVPDVVEGHVGCRREPLELPQDPHPRRGSRAPGSRGGLSPPSFAVAVELNEGAPPAVSEGRAGLAGVVASLHRAAHPPFFSHLCSPSRPPLLRSPSATFPCHRCLYSRHLSGGLVRGKCDKELERYRTSTTHSFYRAKEDSDELSCVQSRISRKLQDEPRRQRTCGCRCFSVAHCFKEEKETARGGQQFPY